MYLSSLSAILLAIPIAVAADIPSWEINPTECKSCPYDLCPNVLDMYGVNTTLTCWTEGSAVRNDTTWLRTKEGCYVTQNDMIEWPGDYTEDLPYCGRIRRNYTTVEARTKYMTDCFHRPSLNEYDMKHYKYGIDLDLVCVIKDGYEILGKKTWYKTSGNCYAHETTLERVEDEGDLLPCGPVPSNLDPRDHAPEPEGETSSTPTQPSALNWAATTKFTAGNAHTQDLSKRFLYNTTIGEEYVNCTTNSSSTNPGRIRRVYEFGQEIFPQCGTIGEESSIWLFTTDFCWVKDVETDPGLQESVIRSNFFPKCEYFTDLS